MRRVCGINPGSVLEDTMAMELWLPPERLEKLAKTVNQWRLRKSCKKQDLLALIGQLQHACQVVKPGRSFLHDRHDRPVEDNERVAPFHSPQ